MVRAGRRIDAGSLHYRVRAVKLLAFSDLHRDRGRARRLVERAGEADVVIGAGDFASFHLGLRRTIEPLSSISTPTVLVPGNNESESALWRACADWPSAAILHGEAKEIDGMTFFGLGGGVPVTPFPWGFDLSEEEAASKLSACPEGAVLVIHSPPKGYVDEAFGRHLGSEAILAAIEAKRPPLAICGHIHQCWGREAQIGLTRVVNVGPDGIMLEL
jgi:Icc-related predicted phosphoesterase